MVIPFSLYGSHIFVSVIHLRFVFVSVTICDIFISHLNPTNQPFFGILPSVLNVRRSSLDIPVYFIDHSPRCLRIVFQCAVVSLYREIGILF